MPSATPSLCQPQVTEALLLQEQRFELRLDEVIAQAYYERATYETTRATFERTKLAHEAAKLAHEQLKATYERLKLDFAQLRTALASKQEVIDLLLPHYPCPITAALQRKIDLPCY